MDYPNAFCESSSMCRRVKNGMGTANTAQVNDGGGCRARLFIGFFHAILTL
jgi:hypothetical protein